MHPGMGVLLWTVLVEVQLSVLVALLSWDGGGFRFGLFFVIGGV